VAVSPEELKVMDDFALGPEGAERNIEFLEPPAIRRLNPALSDQVLGALWAAEDGIVEPQKGTRCAAGPPGEGRPLPVRGQPVRH
jgi:L-2-hydroxyglutarate oxidase LhgO